MLKRIVHACLCRIIEPAAFRRLCVETGIDLFGGQDSHPAAFRRLCVETTYLITYSLSYPSAAFRRLCVETVYKVGNG